MTKYVYIIKLQEIDLDLGRERDLKLITEDNLEELDVELEIPFVFL